MQTSRRSEKVSRRSIMRQKAEIITAKKEKKGIDSCDVEIKHVSAKNTVNRKLFVVIIVVKGESLKVVERESERLQKIVAATRINYSLETWRETVPRKIVSPAEVLTAREICVHRIQMFANGALRQAQAHDSTLQFILC